MTPCAPLRGNIWLLLVLLLAVPAVAAETPRLELDADRRLMLLDLPPILADDGVKEHLMTGLTTSVAFRPEGKLPGGARVDIRYDLWDEVFHVATLGRGERIERAQQSSFEELAEWWRGLELVLLDGDRLERPWPRRLRVRADIVPFSAAEQDDAQRWFSESIEQGRRRGTGEVGRPDEAPGEPLARTFNLLLATSIRRHALASYTWTVTLPPYASPPSNLSPEETLRTP